MELNCFESNRSFGNVLPGRKERIMRITSGGREEEENIFGKSSGENIEEINLCICMCVGVFAKNSG